MTSKRTVTLLYSLHSWCGIVTSVWLFVVCVTGALLVFKAELDLWANPSLRGLPRPAAIAGPDSVLASLKQKQPEARAEFLSPPSDSFPVWSVNTRGGERERIKYAARADTGEVIGAVDSELGQFIRNIHVFVMFGPRWPVGFLGAVALFSLVSGFVIHRKVLRELFTLRWGRSPRVVSADVHRAAGVWGLGFHTVIAFTGAWLGLAPVFERAYDYLAEVPGAADAPLASSASKAAAPTGTAALTESAAPATLAPSIDALLEQAQRDQPGLDVRAILFVKPERPDAAVRLSGQLAGSALTGLSLTYSLATGALLERNDPREQSLLRHLEGYMEPLHFGDFGGVVLQWAYLLLGLVSAGLTATGTLVWLERRKIERRMVERGAVERGAVERSRPNESAGAALLERAMIGLHSGAVASLASMAVLSLWRGRRLELLPLNDGEGPWLWLGLWALFALVIALPRQPRRAWRAGLAACSTTLASAAVIGALQRSPLWASVGTSALAFALAGGALALALREPGAQRARAAGTKASSERAAGRTAARGPLGRAGSAAPWLIWVATLGLCFTWAWVGEGAAVQGPGHAGMLVAVFLLLPGLMLRRWFRRAAALSWLLSAASFAALGAHAERATLGLLAVPIAAVAVALALRRDTGGDTSVGAREMDEARA